jgi:hypothetical protein
MTRKTTILLAFLAACAPTRAADDFRHVGDYLLQSHYKLSGGKIIPIPIKPIAFRVFTDGVTVRIHTEDDPEARSSFEIYRSDGIARQRREAGALEIIPGLQASSNTGGILKHLRMSAEAITITTFPGVSDQTIISHAVAATPVKPSDKPSHQTPEKTTPPPSPPQQPAPSPGTAPPSPAPASPAP